MSEIAEASPDQGSREDLQRRVDALSEDFWRGPVRFDRVSEGSGTLLSGRHEGDAIDHEGALIVGAPGSRYTRPVKIRTDCVFVGVRFESTVTVHGTATAIFRGCCFSTSELPIITADTGSAVHLEGCRFSGVSSSGTVVSGSAPGLAFMVCCSNKTTMPVGVNVTSFGVTT